MDYKNISEFYQKFLFAELSEESIQKLKNVQDENEYRDFIRDEILPLAKAHGYDFSVEDIMAYDEKLIRMLSAEDLADVAGGSVKNVSSVLMSAFMLLSGNSALHAVKPVDNVEVSQSAPGKSDERKKLSKIEELRSKFEPTQQKPSDKTAQEIEQIADDHDGNSSDESRKDKEPIHLDVEIVEGFVNDKVKYYNEMFADREAKSKTPEVGRRAQREIDVSKNVQEKTEKASSKTEAKATVDQSKKIISDKGSSNTEERKEEREVSKEKVQTPDTPDESVKDSSKTEAKATVDQSRKTISDKVSSDTEERKDEGEVSKEKVQTPGTPDESVKDSSKTDVEYTVDQSKKIISDKVSSDEKQEERDSAAVSVLDDSVRASERESLSKGSRKHVVPPAESKAMSLSSRIELSAGSTATSEFATQYKTASGRLQVADEKKNVVDFMDENVGKNLQRRDNEFKRLSSFISDLNARPESLSAEDLEKLNTMLAEIANANKDYEKLFEDLRIYLSLSELDSLDKDVDFEASDRQHSILGEELSSIGFNWSDVLQFIGEDVEDEEYVVGNVADLSVDRLKELMSDICKKYNERNEELKDKFSKANVLDVSMLSKVKLPEVKQVENTNMNEFNEFRDSKLRSIDYKESEFKGLLSFSQKVQIFNRMADWLKDYFSRCYEMTAKGNFFDFASDEDKGFLLRLSKQSALKSIATGFLSDWARIYEIQRIVNMELSNYVRSIHPTESDLMSSSRIIGRSGIREDFQKYLTELNGYVEMFKGLDGCEDLEKDMKKINRIQLWATSNVKGIEIESNLEVLKKGLSYFCEYIEGVRNNILVPLREVCVCFNPGVSMPKFDDLDRLFDTLKDLNDKVQMAEDNKTVQTLQEWLPFYEIFYKLSPQQKTDFSKLTSVEALANLSCKITGFIVMPTQDFTRISMCLGGFVDRMNKAMDKNASDEDLKKSIDFFIQQDLENTRFFSSVTKLKSDLLEAVSDRTVLKEKIKAVEQFNEMIKKIVHMFNSNMLFDEKAAFIDFCSWAQLYGSGEALGVEEEF